MQKSLTAYFGDKKITSIQYLAQAGSDRKYARVIVDDISYILCESNNVKENETFFYFASFFKSHGIPVPQVLYVSDDKTCYIQEDGGSKSLLDEVLQNGHTDAIFQVYKNTISSLVKMQLIGGEALDFSKCYASAAFDKQAVLADLNYFKYYFLDLQKLNYNKADLNNEFEELATLIENITPPYFMYRDFQGRNMMMQNQQVTFIDFQGGMKGPLQYDIASLLWQAKAQLPITWKKELYQHYKEEVQQKISIDAALFDTQYSLIVLVRLLQVLGAYGLRGIIEQRTHFLSSIPLGLANIQEWLTQYDAKQFPELQKLLAYLSTEIDREKYSFPVANDSTKLKVIVQSFSYKKGLPADESGNGGGFMFDCRGILNPGRFEEYKKRTGRDESVIAFLETKTKVNEFLHHAKQVIDISIEDYLTRGFESLIISFGCTGGQHRSVYCTDAMAKHLKEKYNIQATVKHLIQDEKNWVN